MECYSPKQIYSNHTLVIVATTSLLPEGVTLRRLDRYAFLLEVFQCNLPLLETALIGRVMLPDSATQRSSVAFTLLRVSLAPTYAFGCKDVQCIVGASVAQYRRLSFFRAGDAVFLGAYVGHAAVQA